MKQIFPLLLICVLIFTYSPAGAQDSLETQLRNFPVAQYLNRPIDTLIAHLPLGFDTVFVVGSNGNINRGASLQINYPPNNQFWIDVFITDAQYITINKQLTTSPELAWPINLLRKEKIGCIRIYTGAYEIINEADSY